MLLLWDFLGSTMKPAESGERLATDSGILLDAAGEHEAPAYFSGIRQSLIDSHGPAATRRANAGFGTEHQPFLSTVGALVAPCLIRTAARRLGPLAGHGELVGSSRRMLLPQV